MRQFPDNRSACGVHLSACRRPRYYGMPSVEAQNLMMPSPVKTAEKPT